MDAMNGPDLLDVLAAEDSPDVVHMILPNFATACGRGFLEVSQAGEIKGAKLWTLSSQHTTCPECLARGQEADGLPVLCQRISRNQAPGEQ